jgi:[NiFe] hydrogenase diaphorase moiety small subunit
VFGFEGRGINKRIAVDGMHGLKETELKAADRAAHACPTGCLRVKRVGWKVPVGERLYDTTPIGSDIEQKQPVG